MPRFLVVLVVLAILPMAAADEHDAEAARPLAAVLLLGDEDAVISWLPGLEAADSYNVYGVNGKGRALLETGVSLTHTTVSAGFQSYEVTAVQAGIESAPVVATGLPSSCINIHQGPPPSITMWCKVGIELQPQPIQTPFALA